MKKLIVLFLAFITLISFNACSNDDSVLVAKPDTKGLVFTNSFADNYTISQETKDSIADKFVWNSADFGVQSNVTYELQGATTANFSKVKVVGTTSQSNVEVTVANLLELAKDLGIDSDPATTNPDGSANNTGQIYFRIRATLGTAGAYETFSSGKAITITWTETVASGNNCPSLFAVGDALTDIGWNFRTSGEIKCNDNVLQIKAKFTTGNFRFFQESGNWSSALGFSHYKNEGYVIDANLADAKDNDSNFKFMGTPGIYTLTIDNTKKTIVLTASSNLWTVGGAVPGGWNFGVNTVEFVEAIPNIWSASIVLSNGEFRFFHVFNTWDTKNNFAFYDNAGFKINANLVSDGTGDANFKFIGTPGTYKLTINAIDKTITLE